MSGGVRSQEVTDLNKDGRPGLSASPHFSKVKVKYSGYERRHLVLGGGAILQGGATVSSSRPPTYVTQTFWLHSWGALIGHL